jgi:hypothetical protein
MDFNSEVELRQKLIQYLNGELRLSEFEEWFVPKSWNFFENASPSLQSLVADIELLLAEYSNGDWTEAELKRKIAPLATTYRLVYCFDVGQNKKPEPINLTFSGSGLRRSDSSPLSDIQLVAGYA